MYAYRADEGKYRGREAPPRHRDQRNLARDFGVGYGLRPHAGDGWRKFRQKADTEAGGDHHLDPILAFALEADAGREPMLAQSVGEIVAVFAVDPPQVGLAGNIDDADPVLLLESMPDGKRDAKSLAIERQHVEAHVERLGLRHHREIKFAVQQHFREGVWHAFDQGQLASVVCGTELRQKAHKARRADRTHDTEPNLRLLQIEKLLRRRFRRLGIGEELTQMRLDEPAEISQMRQLALAPQQQPAELLLELLDRPGQGRLRDIAVLRRTREIQGVGDRQKIAHLVHLHATTVPAVDRWRKTQPRDTIARQAIVGAHRIDREALFQ